MEICELLVNEFLITVCNVVEKKEPSTVVDNKVV